MVLQESDMFMDALMTASTKSKEPRKRKRRTSITKDGPTEAKKQETASNDNRDVTPPPNSPPSADEKSPVVVKPNFKVRILVKLRASANCIHNRRADFGVFLIILASRIFYLNERRRIIL